MILLKLAFHLRLCQKHHFKTVHHVFKRIERGDDGTMDRRLADAPHPCLRIVVP